MLNRPLKTPGPKSPRQQKPWTCLKLAMTVLHSRQMTLREQQKSLGNTSRSRYLRMPENKPKKRPPPPLKTAKTSPFPRPRSEEHTSELQSRGHLVCRLLLEKKNEPATSMS